MIGEALGFDRMTNWRRTGAMLLVGLAASLAARPALCSVLDIAPDGHVTVIDGPSLHLSSDPSIARPIRGGASMARTAAPKARLAGRPADQVAGAINTASATQRLNPDLIEAVAWQESHLRPDAVSPKGAVGVMQLMPATARSLGVRQDDVSSNVQGGATYLRLLLSRYDGDLVKALAAYNAGPGAVDRHGGPPPYRETRAYVAAVLEQLAERVVPAQPAQMTSPRP